MESPGQGGHTSPEEVHTACLDIPEVGSPEARRTGQSAGLGGEGSHHKETVIVGDIVGVDRALEGLEVGKVAAETTCLKAVKLAVVAMRLGEGQPAEHSTTYSQYCSI